MIPRILHQTCKSDESMCTLWRKCQCSWKTLHPGWKYYFWDDESNEKFVKGQFPHYYGLYCSLPFMINKVDMVRYLYLYMFGGFYVDMDCEAIRSLDSLLHEDRRIIIGERIVMGQKCLECAIIGSVPKHPLWLFMIEGIRQAIQRPSMKQRLSSGIKSLYVLQTTGPWMLTERVHLFCAENPAENLKIACFPAVYFFADVGSMYCLEKSTYSIHYSSASWINGFEAFCGRLHHTAIGRFMIWLLLFLVCVLLLMFGMWLAYLFSLGVACCWYHRQQPNQENVRVV